MTDLRSENEAELHGRASKTRILEQRPPWSHAATLARGAARLSCAAVLPARRGLAAAHATDTAPEQKTDACAPLLPEDLSVADGADARVACCWRRRPRAWGSRRWFRCWASPSSRAARPPGALRLRGDGDGEPPPGGDRAHPRLAVRGRDRGALAQGRAGPALEAAGGLHGRLGGHRPAPESPARAARLALVLLHAPAGGRGGERHVHRGGSRLARVPPPRADRVLRRADGPLHRAGAGGLLAGDRLRRRRRPGDPARAQLPGARLGAGRAPPDPVAAVAALAPDRRAPGREAAQGDGPRAAGGSHPRAGHAPPAQGAAQAHLHRGGGDRAAGADRGDAAPDRSGRLGEPCGGAGPERLRAALPLLQDPRQPEQGPAQVPDPDLRGERARLAGRAHRARPGRARDLGRDDDPDARARAVARRCQRRPRQARWSWRARRSRSPRSGSPPSWVRPARARRRSSTCSRG